MQELKNSYDPAMAPKDLEHVIYEKKGHVAYVTINRPEVSNALHTYAYNDLRACWIDISTTAARSAAEYARPASDGPDGSA